MPRGGLEWTRAGIPMRSACGVLVAAVVTLAVVACGGSAKPAEGPKSDAASSDKPPPGFPSKHDEGWCDPMPDLGNACTKELKECMIVCDYISDTCAMLVCMGGNWDYVERGEGANADDE